MVSLKAQWLISFKKDEEILESYLTRLFKLDVKDSKTSFSNNGNVESVFVDLLELSWSSQ